jgi:hypothetical protein
MPPKPTPRGSTRSRKEKTQPVGIDLADVKQVLVSAVLHHRRHPRPSRGNDGNHDAGQEHDAGFRVARGSRSYCKWTMQMDDASKGAFPLAWGPRTDG